MMPIWLWLIILVVLTLTGLVSGLVSEGLGDYWAWGGLSISVALGGFYAFLHNDNS